MTNKKIRKEILEYLRDMYEQDVDFPVADNEITNAMGIDYNVVRATLNYLSEKKLIDIGKDNLTWNCSINANGIDELEKLESNEEKEDTSTTQIDMKKSPTIFISHSTHDIDLAKQIKSWLENMGLPVFIAHQDIEPAQNFDEVMFEQLKSSLVYVALLTKNFQKSDWCDQEAGIAFATSSIILPVKIDVDPYGFLSKKQALRWNGTLSSIQNLARTILYNLPPKEQKKIRNKLLNKGGLFSRCGSYDEAGLLSFIISDFPDLTRIEIESITESVIKNGQINESRTARRHLESIFKRNQDKIPKKLLVNATITSYIR